jgi:hypothetical protein
MTGPTTRQTQRSQGKIVGDKKAKATLSAPWVLKLRGVCAYSYHKVWVALATVITMYLVRFYSLSNVDHSSGAYPTIEAPRAGAQRQIRRKKLEEMVEEDMAEAYATCGS